MTKTTETFTIFNQPYNICPRFPQGTKWEAGFRGRSGSAAWNMVSFDEALAYVRKQYAHAVAATKARRHPGDEWSQMEFWGFIDGPGGRLEWNDIRSLVVGGIGDEKRDQKTK